MASGEASRWTHLTTVWIPPDSASAYGVEAIRAYGDRLVLKLAGVVDASAAQALRGCAVGVSLEEVPTLPQGVHYVARLIGMVAVDEAGSAVGRVVDVLETGGTDVLRLEAPDGTEVLVPMAAEMVRQVDEASGRIVVRLPEGLADVNRKGSPKGADR